MKGCCWDVRSRYEVKSHSIHCQDIKNVRTWGGVPHVASELGTATDHSLASRGRAVPDLGTDYWIVPRNRAPEAELFVGPRAAR